MKIQRLAIPLLTFLGMAGCATLDPSPKGPPSAQLTPLEHHTRLQIFLDEQKFGPGKIDGELGEFGNKALARYTAARGLSPVNPSVNPDSLPGLRDIHPIFTTYTIREQDREWVGPLPADREAQGELAMLPYTSLLEFVAERFHSDRKFIRKLNPDINVNALRPGSVVRVPNVTPFVIESLPRQGHLLDPKPQLASRVVKIDTRARVLTVLDGEAIVAHFPITPGSSTLPAPRGTWKIVNMASMPYFRHDEKMLNEGVRSEEFVMLPPGPNNPVGVAWMGLSKTGVGMHGTNNPETIGRAASHGCIRLSNWNATRLTGMVTQGGTVRID